ncbi:riboflavin biosynthesis protein RibF [Deltaproteobacteria bacterium Smac51]|nr:riboflavin biosynthesis protein RibF [Deltaproteobacteria bacterium Smac51]
MEFIENWELQSLRESSVRPKTVFTIGVFDGLHLGHRHVIDMVIKSAARLKAQSLVLTFEPHPLEVLAKNAAPPILTTIGQKAEVLESWGLDRLGVLRFNKDMAALEPVKFLNQFLGKFIDPAGVVLGPDFSFGRDATGNADTVAQWLGRTSPKAAVNIVTPLSDVNGEFSSSQIRQDLKSGLVEIAGRALGRPYRLAGVVEHGQARGRTLGFPTANLGAIRQLIPEPGVYAVLARLGGDVYQGMTSIGYNPTFGEQPMTVETNIFDFHDFIYGQEMSIDFMARLRAMIKFQSVEQLVAQLGQDRAGAIRALS